MLIRLAGAALVMMAASRPLAAQAYAAHRGLWAGVTPGYAYASVTCDECGAQASGGATHIALRLGLTAAPRLLVGAEIDAWKRGGPQSTAAEFGLAGYWYLLPGHQVFVKGGVAYSIFRGATFEGPDETGAGVGLIAGLGVDLRLGRSYSISPMLTLTRDNIGTTHIDSTPIRTGLESTIVAVGVGITWH